MEDEYCDLTLLSWAQGSDDKKRVLMALGGLSLLHAEYVLKAAKMELSSVAYIEILKMES